MNKTMLKTGLFLVFVFAGLPHAAAMLGVSSYAATKAVDAIMLGLSFWAVLSLLFVSAGSFAAVWWLIKRLIRKVGRKAAIAW